MPFRLQIVQGEQTLKIPLTEGAWIIGSAQDADIRITHPTVSRRHARLFVGADGVDVEDLGSSNGTRVDGDAVKKRVAVPPGKTVLFGTAVALLENLEAEDSETGIALQGAKPGLRSAQELENLPSMTTLSPSVLEHFSRVFLPDILQRIADGDAELERIQAIGNGLFTGLPCRKLEISHENEGVEAILFSAERKRRQDEQIAIEPVEVSFRAWTIRTLFPIEHLARAYEPLLRSGVLLAGLASFEDRMDTLPHQKLRKTPELPSPATVSPTVQKIYSSAARVAAGPISVLIHGESGTGKELLARYIHAASPRAEAPLVTLNCAALSRDLLESELFGVEKGVATGVDSRPGRFEQAHGGTLFLDEIGDMAPETQAKILRVLQEKEVFRLGSGEPRKADVRVVSATNRNIKELMESGAFRTDLYHRIADWTVELPALRHRREDIPNLAVHFLATACKEAGVAPAGISRAALNVLSAAAWPGNIRQLEREMSRVALFLDDGDLLESTHLQPSLFETGNDFVLEGASYRAKMDAAERQIIESALALTGGDVGGAAKKMKIGRSTLYRRMTELGMKE